MRVKGEKAGLAEKEALLANIRSLHESNPCWSAWRTPEHYMPEIVEMQVRSIFEAAANQTLKGVVVKPEVMIRSLARSKSWSGSSRAWCALLRP